MESKERVVRKAALKRVATIFRLPEAMVDESMVFGEHLNVSSRSDFRRNEFDIILDDIRDMANKDMIAKIDKGEINVRTVKEYCDYMLVCYLYNHEEVGRLLGINLARQEF